MHDAAALRFVVMAQGRGLAQAPRMSENPPMSISTSRHGHVFIVTINRPEVKNAVDGKTAHALSRAVREFEAAEDLHVGILTGAGGTFCAGADLKAISAGNGNRVEAEGDGPMGPTRMMLRKPFIAAIEGHAVAGGLELALWCDLRVAAKSAVFGVYCRRFGVPLIDGGTVRLARAVGQSRAMDMILTGRSVNASEAYEWGLVNRLCADGKSLDAAVALAEDIAAHPQQCLRNDRASAMEQWSLPMKDALAREFEYGLKTLESGETMRGASAFVSGRGRGGAPVKS